MSRIKLYRNRKFKLGKKKISVWLIHFDPGRAPKDHNWPGDWEYSQVIKHIQECNPGLDTSWNKLADNSHAQCPKCNHIFDHTLPENNEFDGVEFLYDKDYDGPKKKPKKKPKTLVEIMGELENGEPDN